MISKHEKGAMVEDHFVTILRSGTGQENYGGERTLSTRQSEGPGKFDTCVINHDLLFIIRERPYWVLRTLGRQGRIIHSLQRQGNLLVALNQLAVDGVSGGESAFITTMQSLDSHPYAAVGANDLVHGNIENFLIGAVRDGAKPPSWSFGYPEHKPYLSRRNRKGAQPIPAGLEFRRLCSNRAERRQAGTGQSQKIAYQ